MAGRKPLPTALKLIKGNPGKRPLNKFEPSPVRKIPACPKHLTSIARIEWRRIVKELDRLGLMTCMDRSALAAYCQAYGRWVEAEEKVSERGFVVKTVSGNIIQNPYLAIANKSMDHMYKFLTEFGMTPSSRSRISTKGDTVNNEWDGV